MKKVMLISPPFERFMGLSRFYYHIGLASLAAVIDKAGHDVLIYDADYDPDGKMLSAKELMDKHCCYEKALKDNSHPILKEVIEIVTKYKPDII